MDISANTASPADSPAGQPSGPSQSLRQEPPLFVDLDGTLLRTDVFWESLAAALRSHPLRVWLALFSLMWGPAPFMRAIGELSAVNPESLPYRRALLRWLQEQHRQGRRIILATAADAPVAQSVAKHLGIFESVLASDGRIHNKGARKLESILAYTKDRAFDYCANARADLVILANARQAYVVGASRAVIAAATRAGNADLQFARKMQLPQFRYWIKAIRPFHWLKNLLVLVPFFTAFLVTDSGAFINAMLAAGAMCLAASAGYLINDLLDMQADRLHPRKRARPFASARLTAAQGFGGALALLLCAGALALLVNVAVLIWVMVYLFGTFAYSIFFKREPIVDVTVLAGLHTLRIVVGNYAVGVELSFWLLAFSVFFFFSLAIMKRCGELVQRRERGEETTSGRGYRVADLSVLQPTGIAASLAAVLVLALYARAPEVLLRYPMPEALWLALGALLMWLTRAWFDTTRGLMLDDPLLYALRHRRGRIVLLIIGASFSVAALWSFGD